MTQHQKIAALFPGQGAQYVGMAKDFIQQFSIARHTFEEAEEILQFSLTRLILEGPEEQLTETKNSQVAIFTVGVAMFRVVHELFGIKPFVCAGLSLGEYTALHISGWISFSNALQLVQKRGYFMNAACGKRAGTMAVILGLEDDAVKSLVAEAKAPEDLWIANYNCPEQVVISGSFKGIEKGTLLAKERGAKRVLPLQVHGAFHSGMMEEAKLHLAPYIEAAPLVKGSSKIVMNASGGFASSEEDIRQLLINQVTHSVRWSEGIKAIDTGAPDLFLEFGPGKTLSGMNKKIGVLAPTLSIEKVEDLQKLSDWISLRSH